MFWSHLPAGLVALATTALAALDLQMGSDDDLTKFVSRPEIRAPLFNVSVYDESQIEPGYWFVAPYAMIGRQYSANRYYEACQTGPAIYDQRGELIWSGACQVRNQNTCDFRIWVLNDTLYMSAILTAFWWEGDEKGHGMVMDSSFETVSKIDIPADLNNINMHELQLTEDGTKAFHIINQPTLIRPEDIKQNDTLKVLDNGFREVDVATGETTFEWWAYQSGQVRLEESNVREGYPVELEDPPFNWFHGNSVDKDEHGDYLMSSRYTDTIYKISAKDGSVLWRLGGRSSSFAQDFNFSRQHDARWLLSSETKARISFLNNAADDNVHSANTSAALVVDLDLVEMKATISQSILRPDGQLTRLRGNHQILDNGNHFVCWSENSYISEHSPDGKMLLQAQFASGRFVTYRAYKANFTGHPVEPPTVKAFKYGTSLGEGVTVIYVSWNGATEVASWRFWSQGVLLGEIKKTTFETMFETSGRYSKEVMVEALDRHGTVLGHGSTAAIDPMEHVDHHREVIGLNEQHPTSQVAVLGNKVGIYLFAFTAVLLCCTLVLCQRCCSSRPSWLQSRPDDAVDSDEAGVDCSFEKNDGGRRAAEKEEASLA